MHSLLSLRPSSLITVSKKPVRRWDKAVRANFGASS